MSKKSASKNEATKISKITEITPAVDTTSVVPSTEESSSIQSKLLRFGVGKILLGVILIVLSVGGFFGYRYLSFLYLAPSVVAGNFAMEYKKIPYNIPSIDITFSHDIDPNTVNANSVRLYPFVTGKPTLKNPRTISYALSSKLTIGTKYLLQFTTDITTTKGTRLENEITYELEAIGGVVVTKMIPDSETVSLSKNPIFIFNIPVVPLGSLESQDQLPCPVKFVPEIKGRCTWPSANILEYRLDSKLDAATKYQATISLGSEFLYPLEKPFNASFTTTPLMVLTGSLDDSGVQRFSPKDGIPLVFSAPVATDVLTKSLKLKNEQGGDIAFRVTPIVSGETSSNNFFVTGEKGALPFATKFNLSIQSGLMPSPGNIPMKDSIKLPAVSNAFVNRTNFSKTIWSSTGAFVEAQNMYTTENYLPPAKPKLSFFLDEPVDLATLGGAAATAVKLREIKSAKEYLCLLTQPQTSVPEFPDSLKMVMKPDLQRLDCQINDVLPFDTEFEIIFDTSISKSLAEPVKMKYQTAKQFEIKEIVLQKATELCIYATANIDYTGSGMVTNPKSMIRSIGSNEEVYNYATRESKKICPEKSGMIASVANIRLDGKTKYDFLFNTDLKDVYGTSLKVPYSKNGVISPALQKSDEYLYFMPEKRVQVIPLDASIVLPIQTINLDAVNLEVCSLSPKEYANYLSEPGVNPNCSSTTFKKIPVKNGKWNLTTQKIDLASDVMDGNLPGNILLVRGSADASWKHNWPEQRDFEVVYLRSNLALMLESSEKKTIVFASDFAGKILPKDLKFEAYKTYSGCDTNWTTSLKFNAEKNYYEAPSSECSGVLVAQNDTYYGVVSTNTDETSNYDFGQYGGSDSSNREYVYLHTDRPIYRAGNTVNFQGILRSFAATGYIKSTAKKVKIRILNSQGTLFKELTAIPDSHASFEGSFPLTTEMNTGRYSFEVFAYNSTDSENGNYVVNDGNFYVEQYSKPVFKTEVSGGKRDLFEGDTIDVTATASYYFGGRVTNTSVDWNILAQNYYFDPKNYSEYRFGTDTSFMECRYWGNCSNHDQYLGNFQNHLDSTGTNTIKYTAELPNPEESVGGEQVGTPDAKKERLITFNAEVTDPNTGKVITGSDTHIVHVTDGYVGVNSPYWIDKNEKISVKGVTLDLDAKVQSAKVKLELIQLQWNMVKKLGVDGYFYEEYEMNKTLEATETVTSSKDGIFQTELTPKLGGEYLIRASYTGKNGAAYVSDSYSYVATDTFSLWNSGNNSVTDLTAEKTMMQPGETAIFTLKSPVSTGKLIYSVEKDNTILDTKVVDITGFGQKIEIPVVSSYIPNVYIRAYLIGMPETGGLPIFKRALSQIRVLPDSKKLTVDLTAEKPTYLPGETLKVTVQVKDANGKPVSGAIGSLAVVDASVLALLGNPEKNPFAFFYDMKRYLGTRVSVSLMNLVEKLEVKNTLNGEKGGAGEGNKGGDTKKKRGIFKDTAFWTGKFTTDASGKAVIDTGKLPDNLTTWKIEAVIATDDTQIGAGRTSITTEQKVMIQENFPRFLRTGDQMNFAPVIFNRTGKRQRFTIEMQTKGAKVTPTKQEIALDNNASLPVIFQVKGILDTNLNSAPVELSVTAKAEDGSEDGIQKTLMLTRGESYETTAFIGTASGVGLDDKLDLTGIREGGILTLKTSPTLLGNVFTGLDNLLTYPYGCLEQITSAIIPHIAVKNIHDALKTPYDLKTVKMKYYDYVSSTWEERTIYDVLGDYVVKLMGYRMTSGGFSYWNSHAAFAEFNYTAYAVNTLAQIQALGIPVDQYMSSSAVTYLKNRLEQGSREGCFGPEEQCRYSLSEKIAAITAIAKWSTDGIDALKAYKTLGDIHESITSELDTLTLISELLTKKGITETEKTALKTTSKSLIEQILQSSLVYDPRGAYVAPNTGTSRTEATAKFVRALALLGEDTGANSQILDNMSRFLSRTKQADGSYGSTYETALVLQAFADRTKSDSAVMNTNFQATTTLGGKSVYSKNFDSKNILETTMDTLDIKSLTDKEVFHIDTVGKGKLYYDLSLKYPIAADKVQSRDEGFFVETNYYDYIEYQKIESAKNEENKKYQQGKMRYSELKYPKEVREYVSPIKQTQVGQLVRVEYRVIVSETRDKVAFESFITAGSELINTRLATETKTVTSDTFFDREDLMDDRYFGYSEVLTPGEYTGSYAIRFTHTGNFMIPATRISEFATPEVFGQTNGKRMEVK